MALGILISHTTFIVVAICRWMIDNPMLAHTSDFCNDSQCSVEQGLSLACVFLATVITVFCIGVLAWKPGPCM